MPINNEIFHCRLNKNDDSGEENPVMRIGNNNVFEVGSSVESKMIGDNNVLECKSPLLITFFTVNDCIPSIFF